jgi:Mg2+/Co2+ transporter CorB
MDDPYSLLLLIAIVVLLLLSALISGSEIAFFSLTPSNLDELENDSSGKLIPKLLQKPKVLLATILVANNFINIAIVIISTYLTAIMTASISGWLKFTVEVVVGTFLILLFGEILP